MDYKVKIFADGEYIPPEDVPFIIIQSKSIDRILNSISMNDGACSNHCQHTNEKTS